MNTPDELLLREFVALARPPCPVCHELLTAIDAGARCPHCTAALALGLGADRLRLGRFLLLLTPSLMFAAIGVIGCVGSITALTPPVLKEAALYGGAALNLLAAMHAPRLRTRFVRVRPAVQIGAIITNWLLQSALFCACVALAMR